MPDEIQEAIDLLDRLCFGTSDAALLLGSNLEFVRGLIARGDIKAYRRGGDPRYLVTKVSVAQYLDNNGRYKNRD